METTHRTEKARERGQRISRQPWKAFHDDRPIGTFPTKAEAEAAITSCQWCPHKRREPCCEAEARRYLETLR